MTMVNTEKCIKDTPNSLKERSLIESNGEKRLHDLKIVNILMIPKMRKFRLQKGMKLRK